MSEALISPIVFTIRAADKVWELIQEEENYNLKLRVYVTGGGCSGFQYGFKFDEVINDDDTIVTQTVEIKDEVKTNNDITKNVNINKAENLANSECSVEANDTKTDDIKTGDTKEDGIKEDDIKTGERATVQLLVDPISYPYLVGAEIDYKEDLEGAQFIIRNPNAKTTCGCGSSFST